MKSPIDILLEIEFQSAVESLGIRQDDRRDFINEENLYSMINHIELSVLKNPDDKSISTLCSLLYTHFGSKFEFVGEYIFTVMSRIGFSPVSRMLQNSKDQKISVSSMFSAIDAELNGRRISISAFGTFFRLTNFQKTLWDTLEKSNSVAVSAPTSAGKSFLICLNLVNGISQFGGVSIYIVPTLTLMNQVAGDLFEISARYKIDLSIETHLRNSQLPLEKPTVFVLTQERIADFIEVASVANISLNYLVIDEVQNLERAFEFTKNDVRSKLLLDVIIDLHDSFQPRKTVIAGPRISEINDLSTRLFRKNGVSVTASSSPVANICYSIHPYGSQIQIKQYSELRKASETKILPNDIGACDFGKTLYSTGYHGYLTKVLNRNSGSLIFSPTSAQARKTALHLSSEFDQEPNEYLHSLSEYIKDSVSPSYDLALCVENGVAYHHGKMPHHVRNAIEFAISKSLFSQVVCTTTLMQGVNIPAKNVIIRNPNLFVKKGSSETPVLSNYEIANLRGRAGRLLRDFVGRTFILDGTSFEEGETQTSLFEPVQKTIDGSYSSVFSENREEILDSIVHHSGSKQLNTLSTYIASIIFTEPNPIPILERKGIQLTPQELNSIKSSQMGISIGKDVCKKHRYWNPRDLDRIYQIKNEFDLPIMPFSEGAKDKLAKTILKLNQVLPWQCQFYLGKKSTQERSIWVLAKLASWWSTETTLKQILSEPYSAKSNDNTDSTISTLQNTISFGIPALLSPVYTLLAPDSSMLSAIESGTYRKITSLLLKNNIPRETAIKIAKGAEARKIAIDSVSDAVGYLRNSNPSIWDAIQFRHFVDYKSIIK